MRHALMLAMILLAAPAQAASQLYRFDTSHTSLLFMVSHAGFSKMVGEFHAYEGTLDFDPRHPEKSVILVTIFPKSVDTDVPALDEKLRGEDFFHVQRFPEVVFESKKILLTGENQGRLEGSLTLLGHTRPVGLDVVLNKKGWDQWSGRHKMGFSVSGTFKRSEFGMTWGLPLIGDEVRLTIEAEMEEEVTGNR